MPYSLRTSRPLHRPGVPLRSSPSYSTTWPNVENPISEGGVWTCGGAVGIDWTNPECVVGKAFGTNVTGTPVFDDSIACLSSLGFAPDVTAQGTIFLGSPGASTHELELLLRFSISAHDAHGYECNYAFDGSYTEIVRWNGPLNNFTMGHHVSSPAFGAPQTGDVMKAFIVGNNITVTMTRSGVETVVNTLDITTIDAGAVWTTGSPGIGFWHGNSDGSYGFTSYSAF